MVKLSECLRPVGGEAQSNAQDARVLALGLGLGFRVLVLGLVLGFGLGFTFGFGYHSPVYKP